MDPILGRRIAGKYEALSMIGRGAMGIVYKARQVALDKMIALKVLEHDLRGDPEFMRRFHTEARAASRLDHPHSTRVLDFGEEPDGLLYIAMELLEGRSLHDVLREEFPLPVPRIASLMSQTLSAVGAAHKLGILHRDLKPDNIMILEGRDEEDRPIDIVKVCDFGIAKLDNVAELHGGASVDEKDVKRTNIVGTPEYMSPEQASGVGVDTRTDLYSLGIVLFEMMTGHTPFEGKSAVALMQRHLREEPRPPSSIRPDVDPTLEAICMRALRKNKEDRYASAREMRNELRALIGPDSVPIVQPTPRSLPQRVHDPGAATLAPTPAPSPPPSKRGRHVALAGLVLVAVGAVALSSRWRHPSIVTPAPTAQASETARIEPPAASSIAAPLETVAPLQSALVVRTSALRATAQSTTIDAAAVATMEPVAPPPPIVTSTAPPPATTAPATTTAAPQTALDPSRARVEIASINPDRINVASVDSGLRHVDFTSCYRSTLAQTRTPISGTGTLDMEMDEERVTHAVLAGNFPSALKQCIASRALSARVPNVDTGSASAKVTLRFVLQ